MKQRLLSVIALVSLSRCALDWDRYDPRRVEVSTSDAVAEDTGPRDVVIDVLNCGAAGLPCCVGNACDVGLVCSGGSCMLCPPGQTGCGGRCVDLSTNNDHCGSCGTNCRGSRTCQMGMCR